MNLGFRRMREEDLALVHEWLQRPHVMRWWRDRAAYEDTVERYLPAIEGTDPTDLYLADPDAENAASNPRVREGWLSRRPRVRRPGGRPGARPRSPRSLAVRAL